MAKQRVATPEVDFLRAVLDYDPTVGLMVWKERPSWTFTPSDSPERARIIKAWNARFAGKIAGCVAPRGWLTIRINGESYLAHRLAYKMYCGDEPEEVEPENGDFTDLRAANLRPTDQLYSRKNHSMWATNTSGHRGVHWDSGKNRWRAKIRVNNKVHALGYHTTLDRAVDARARAEIKYGWKPAKETGASPKASPRVG